MSWQKTGRFSWACSDAERPKEVKPMVGRPFFVKALLPQLSHWHSHGKQPKLLGRSLVMKPAPQVGIAVSQLMDIVFVTCTSSHARRLRHVQTCGTTFGYSGNAVDLSRTLHETLIMSLGPFKVAVCGGFHEPIHYLLRLSLVVLTVMLG